MIRERDGEPDGVEDDAAPDSGPRWSSAVVDRLPDVRDGLTRLERVILWQLAVTGQERGGRMVPTAMLYGRVVEHVDVDEREFLRTLSRLVGKGRPGER